jgi:outer membrane protein assembly factor BamB
MMNRTAWLGCALVAGFLTLTQTLSAASVDWTFKVPEAVKWQSVTAVGTLLVGTDKAIYSIDPETGAQQWARTDIPKSSQFNVREITGTPILLINDYGGAINPKTQIRGVNIFTGENIWETEKVQGYPVGVFPLASKNMAVVFANLTAAEGTGLYMTAHELTTGKQLWQVKHSKWGDVPMHLADNSGKFFATVDLSGHQEPVVQGDLLYVPFAGVHCYDLKTGTLKWGSAFKTVPKEFKRASAPLVFDGDTVYASGINKVMALDKNTGAVKWETKKVYSGTVTQLLPAGDKLVIRMGGNFLNPGAKQWALEKPLAVFAVNKATGEQAWEYKEIKDGITNLLLVEGGDTVFLADAGNLIGIDLNSTGKVKETFKVPLEFKRKLGGGEAAAKIGLGALGGIGGLASAAFKAGSGKDRMDIPVAVMTSGKSTFVVRGRQHLLSFDAIKKEIQWSTYYAAPGASGFEMAIMTALTAFNGLAYNGAYASGSMSLDSASGGIKQSLAQYDNTMNKRHSNTQAGAQNVYVLTTVEEGKSKGVGLMAIGLGTGDETAKVLLKDKEPDYAVDELTGRLYYVKDKKEIIAYSVR